VADEELAQTAQRELSLLLLLLQMSMSAVTDGLI